MMQHAATITDTGVSAQELRQLRIRLRDGCDGNLDQILNAYLEYLQSQLLGGEADMDIGQVQEMLLEIASVVQAGQVKDRKQEFGRFISGLVGIYRSGLLEQGSDRFHHTVGDYAELLKSISRELPEHDYDEALQQLFLYMNRMFELQQKEWVDILNSIVSMPETVGLAQLRKCECFPQIREWVEGGVQNLFQIRSDLLAMVRKLEMRERLVEQQMTRLQNSYQNRHGEGNLLHLKQGKMARALVLLRRKLVAIQGEGAEKRDLVGVVDSNIQEFQYLMAAARRSFFMRVVPEQIGLESRKTSNWPEQVPVGKRSPDVTSLQIISS